ncbi:Deoxyribodipyrimidine photo-lyase [Roseovarius sp. THAF27]|uniref:FAD-binding domain-containing protein n=1 Tax=Roseovarius sp. THAF27 TaxID=2587850 RepID=UPI0012681FDD|nr:FAD-binding domain-containing protein [Roseovarius sp. THAF27]QFT82442.1 Deoxyribodipyrimidine photo-lyase [Roseovarius sp. THAF27]
MTDETTAETLAPDWPTPTRDAAEAHLARVLPQLGARYAHNRNVDKGTGRHDAVSRLSPYLRRRMITEPGLIAAVLRAHGPETGERFLQEVLWRSYFKGWLERRPQVWQSYRDGLRADLAQLDRDSDLRRAVERAEAGQTDLDCMNAWAQELTDTGYLHNHARMWFASIWIFTLRLPWRLGADFFYRHLLDGDPASNMLSWRWVAGLHTRGKFYAAEAWNIAKFTDHRFSPDAADLAGVTEGLENQEPDGLPELQPLRTPVAPDAGVPTALLITEEDCRPDDFALGDLDIRARATLAASALRSPRPVGGKVVEFEAAALADTAQRITRKAENLQANDPAELARWATRAGARQIATPYVPEGPLRDWLNAAKPALDNAGVTLREWRRDWDAIVWPHATAGYFKVRKKLPELLHDAGLD